MAGGGHAGDVSAGIQMRKVKRSGVARETCAENGIALHVEEAQVLVSAPRRSHGKLTAL